MNKNDFKGPLLQSAAVLAGVVILIVFVASSGDSGSGGGGFGSMLAGIGSLLLYVIGLGASLVFSIAILIAIFLGAVAMVDSAQAAQMYGDLKKKISVR